MTVQKLKRTAEFRNIFRIGTKRTGKYLSIYVMHHNDICANRIGLVVKKEIGNSVQRNRIKRILREIWRKKVNNLLSSCDMIIMVKKTILHAPFEYIQKDLVELVDDLL